MMISISRPIHGIARPNGTFWEVDIYRCSLSFVTRLEMTEILLTRMINSKNKPICSYIQNPLMHCYKVPYISICMALCSTERH